MALGELDKARSEADDQTASVRDTRDLYMAAFVWEFSARLAFASGAREKAEQDITQALETLKTVEVPVAAWRVHATAWDVYRRTDSSRAENERAKARAIILQLAQSLETVESLRERFLTARPVRRVLEGEVPEPGKRSRVSA